MLDVFLKVEQILCSNCKKYILITLYPDKEPPHICPVCGAILKKKT